MGSQAGIGAQRPRLTSRDHKLAVLFGMWMVLGLFLDGWAHDNGKPESFFTPWHGLLYSGFTAAAATAVLVALRSRRAGVPWRDTLPEGHGLTLAGLGVFGVGAVGDLIWHELLGIEVGIEALLSPTHLLLLLGGLIALSGPLRAAWGDSQVRPASLRAFLPTVLSLALLTAVVAFFMAYLSPFANDAAGQGFDRYPGMPHEHPSADFDELRQLLGVASILMTSVLLAVPALLVLRRWRPPPGTFMVLFGVTAGLLLGLDEFALPSLLFIGPLAGWVVDRLARRPEPLAPVAAVAAGIVVLWLAYFAFYALETGAVAWTAELWAGTTFMSGLLAAGLGLLIMPKSSDELDTATAGK